MEDLGVVQQLDVAGLEVHLDVESRVVGDGLDEVERLALRVGESRDLRVALRVADVPADVEDAWHGAVDVVEDGQREGRVVAGRLLAVAVPPHRLVEHVEQVGSPAEDLVVDGVAAGELALATGPRRVKAQQADDVGAVGVEVLPLAGAVEADLGAGALDALVAHVPEEGARRVLADRRAEVEAERRSRRARSRGSSSRSIGKRRSEHEPAARLRGRRRCGREPRVSVGSGKSSIVTVSIVRPPACAARAAAAISSRCVVSELDRPPRRVGDVGREPGGGRVEWRSVLRGRGHQQQRASASGTEAQPSESAV